MHGQITATSECQRRRAKQAECIKNTDRYKRAKSCQHCTDTGDSLGRYVSTYCHLKHEHMAGFGDKDTLEQCFTCEDYQKRKEAHK